MTLPIIFLSVHYYLDLGDMTMGQAHDTPLGLGQQLCEILFKTNMTVRSYGVDKECCDYNYNEGKCWLINRILQQSAIL